MTELATLQEQVRFGARTLQRKLDDIWGHCTARLPAEAGREGFMLTYLRIPFKPTPPDEVYYFDYDGRLLKGRGAVPMEIPLYTKVYRARPDVQSVVHVHPKAAVTLGLTGQTVQAHQDGKGNLVQRPPLPREEVPGLMRHGLGRPLGEE